jgi:hypothetical protein
MKIATDYREQQQRSDTAAALDKIKSFTEGFAKRINARRYERMSVTQALGRQSASDI